MVDFARLDAAVVLTEDEAPRVCCVRCCEARAASWLREEAPRGAEADCAREPAPEYAAVREREGAEPLREGAPERAEEDAREPERALEERVLLALREEACGREEFDDERGRPVLLWRSEAPAAQSLPELRLLASAAREDAEELLRARRADDTRES